ncbi:MAG: hypothetical protein HY302_01915 [Opitutae bacterium]|nr:hypothetical protein [Opitutae bacterium]
MALLTAAIVAGCAGPAPQTAQASWTVRSQREFAERRDALAADLYKTGRAKSVAQAQTLATVQTRLEEAAAAKAAKKSAAAEAFAKELAAAKQWDGRE